jgi:hypothetical protein
VGVLASQISSFSQLEKEKANKNNNETMRFFFI